MKKAIITVLLIMVLLTSGCTRQLKNAEKEIVKNDLTGQTLTANILCQPENEETISAYTTTLETSKIKLQEKLTALEITQSDYDKETAELVDITTLPKCSEFKITDGGYEGIWTSIFIKPLAWIILATGTLVGNYGLAVILITLLIRIVLYPVTMKTAKQSEEMQKAKPELEKIEKKYKDKKDKESLTQKSQETMMIYKKYGINPVAGCLFAVIQIPLFFAFYEALNRLPAIFEGRFLGIQLGTTAGTAILKGELYYIVLVVLVIAATFFSIKLNKTASMDPSQAKSMKTMMNVMIVMISIASFTVSSAIAIYWIANSGFTIIQNLIAKKVVKK